MNIRIHYSESEILTCMEAWKAMQRHPNADYDFYALINRVRNQRPCVLEFRRGEKTTALWVGRIEEGLMPVEFGYLKFGRLRVRQLNIINGGILGEDSEEVCRAMLDCAIRLLDEHQLQFVSFSYVPCDHRVFSLARRSVAGWLSRDWGVTPNQHWRMSVPASFEDFLKKRSKKHRYWLKRLPRVIDDDFPNQVKMRAFTKLEDVREFCREADSVAKLTYQHQLGSAFGDNEEYRDRCELLAKQGALRGYIYYINQKPVAYWFVTAYQDTLHLNYTGYVPEFRKYEVGTVLLLKLIEDHCGSLMKKVDFGLGAALYKERFGDEEFTEATVRIYKASLRAQSVKLLAALNAQVVMRLKSLLNRLGLLQKIKTYWRTKLVKQG